MHAVQTLDLTCLCAVGVMLVTVGVGSGVSFLTWEFFLSDSIRNGEDSLQALMVEINATCFVLYICLCKLFCKHISELC